MISEDSYVTRKMAQFIKKFHEDLDQRLFAALDVNILAVEDKPEKNVKLAMVIINGKQEMIGVDNQTMKGFAIHEKYPTIAIPLIPKKYDEFKRWATTFDV